MCTPLWRGTMAVYRILASAQNKKVGPVAANPDNLENNKEAAGGAQGTQGSSKNCRSRDSVPPLSHLTRGFRNKDH